MSSSKSLDSRLFVWSLHWRFGFEFSSSDSSLARRVLVYGRSCDRRLRAADLGIEVCVPSCGGGRPGVRTLETVAAAGGGVFEADDVFDVVLEADASVKEFLDDFDIVDIHYSLQC